MAVQSYQDLIGWKKSMALVIDVYRSTKGFPKEELYGLTSQIRRAAVSIPSNIAQGQGRLTRGEFRQFLGHARGSVFELDSQVLIATELGYLSESELQRLRSKIQEVGRILNGLLNSLSASSN
ncbi:MAG TPA: four helix bundle protein [Terriglobales bacterium]|jgi:four helix bundle protein